jgi:oligo-1,6-glucosidase
VGDLRGILSKLDHLVDLGVDVLWLSPVYRSPQHDNGYDISDYQDIDPLFGSLADLDALIAALHERGMKLLMDLVVNHTSDEHPWFTASRSSRDDPKRDWYWWRPAASGDRPRHPGAEPNNWGAFFSGPAWTFDEATGEYYLQLFSAKQPDLNWEHPEVRAAVYEMMRWWLDRGVDGFRMDVINMISKDPSLPDGPVPPGATYGDGTPHFLSGPRIHEFLQEMHREVLAGREGLLTVGEMPGVTIEQAVLYTDPARASSTWCSSSSTWASTTAGTSGTCSRWTCASSRPRSGAGRRGWPSAAGTASTGTTTTSRGSCPASATTASTGAVRKALGTVLHLHRGTPFVYQGEELGMPNAPWASVDDFRDLESVNHYADALAGGQDPLAALAGLRAMSRDNAGTPVQWDASPHAGFTTGTPWLPVHPTPGRSTPRRSGTTRTPCWPTTGG